MQAFEFSTTIANGVIQLPDSFKEIDNAKVRVILLTEKREKTKTQKQNLQAIFAKMKGVEMFKEIKNPTAWQKQIRDEWE